MFRFFKDLSFGYVSACEQFDVCLPVKRRKYMLRHWVWSGIFPFEGGFLPDPHFICSNLVAVPKSVRRLLGCADAKFQLMDVNPGFQDYSSEALLLFQVDEQTYEYSLRAPGDIPITAAPALNYDPGARLFENDGGIAVLINFFRGVRGFYHICLPLRSGQRLELKPAGGPDFELIASSFRTLPDDRDLKSHFCDSRRLDFIAFYEYYRGSCEEGAEREPSAIRDDFEKFWKTEYWNLA